LQVRRICLSKALKGGRIRRQSKRKNGGGGRAPGDHRARLRRVEETGRAGRSKGAAEDHEIAALDVRRQEHLLHAAVRQSQIEPDKRPIKYINSIDKVIE
jgi:hypothetical protein